MDFKEILGTELLEKLTAVELLEPILSALAKPKLIQDTGNLVDKADYLPRKVYNEDKAKWQSQLEERTSDLEALKEQFKENEGASAKVNELIVKSKESEKSYKADIAKARKEHAVELKLHKAGAKHPELIKGLISLDAVTESNGGFIGIDDQIKLLKDGDYKDQFGAIVPDGSPPDESKPKPRTTELAELEKAHKAAIGKNDTLAAVRLKRQIKELQGA